MKAKNVLMGGGLGVLLGAVVAAGVVFYAVKSDTKTVFDPFVGKLIRPIARRGVSMLPFDHFWQPMEKPWAEIYAEKMTIAKTEETRLASLPCAQPFRYIDLTFRIGKRGDEIDPSNKYLEISGVYPEAVRAYRLYFGPYSREIEVKGIPTCNLDGAGDYRSNIAITIYDTRQNKEAGFGGQNSFDIFKWRKMVIDLYPEGIEEGGPDSAGPDWRIVKPLETR